MSDVTTGGPGPCPECDGAGVTMLGPLTFICGDCDGTGRVGGDEPERDGGYRKPRDGEEYDPAVHGPLPPATGEYRAWWPPGR